MVSSNDDSNFGIHMSVTIGMQCLVKRVIHPHSCVHITNVAWLGMICEDGPNQEEEDALCYCFHYTGIQMIKWLNLRHISIPIQYKSSIGVCLQVYSHRHIGVLIQQVLTYI